MATGVEHLGRFAARASFGDLSAAAVGELKIRVLDALGCAIGALDGEPIGMIRAHLADFGGAPRCSIIAGGPGLSDDTGRLVGGSGRTSPDRAAFYNGALVRYLDFNDSYLAPGETCHPSDNVAPVLAAAEYAEASGKDFLAALAVAYQVQCRLSDVAPVRARGFDHTTQGAYAAAAGVARALGLDPERTAHAVAISGTAYNALRVTRTGTLSHWKGLAFPNAAFGAVHAAFLAMRGITGPLEVFEGDKGFMDAIAGPFEIDWEGEDLERVRRTILKRYNAEVHSQSAVEGILQLQAAHGFAADDVERIEIDVFDVAFNIIGGGEEGAKMGVRTKEEADHSLPYIVSAAVLDGTVMPGQYAPERIVRDDIQTLHRKVTIRPNAEYSRRFPGEMPCRIVVHLADGRVVETEKRDYEGFTTRPMTWDRALAKFHRLAGSYADGGLRREIADAVANVDAIPTSDLARLLAGVPEPTRGT